MNAPTDPSAPSRGPRRPPGPWVPLAVGLTLLVGSLTVALLLRAREERALLRATRSARMRVVRELRERIAGQFEDLGLLAHRWVQRPAPAVGGDSAWAGDAQALLDHLGFMESIQWLDASLRVRRTVPAMGAKVGAGSASDLAAHHRQILEAARSGGAIVLKRALDGLGLRVCVPIRSGDRLAGFLVGLVRIEPLLQEILQNVAPRYAVQIWDGPEQIYRRSIAPAISAPTEAGALAVLNLRWRIEVTPSPGVVTTYRTQIPLLVLAGGVLQAFFLALAVSMARKAGWRAHQLEAANRWLGREVKRRERAERRECSAVAELGRVVNSLPDHVWSARVDAPGSLSIRYYSQVVERISGRPARRYYEEPDRWFEDLHPTDHERVRAAYADVVAGRVQDFEIEYRVVRPEGERRWVRDRVVASIEDGERRLDGVIADITKSRQAEEERLRLEGSFQQAQKLESLGLMAGGIAHDFNNLLTGVLGNARLASENLPDDSSAQPSLARVERAALRAADLCGKMLAYAGMGSFETEPVDLRELAEEMGDLLRATISPKVALENEFAAELPRVEADATQLRQVVMNLITNASEAIGVEPGIVRIRVGVRVCSREVLERTHLGSGLPEGRYVFIEVADNGCGMGEEVQRRIFEPFFSTKFMGRGLGLAAVLGIIRAHGGTLDVQSIPGQGSRLTVLLPPAEEVPERPGIQPPPAETVWRGCGTVLLVDDESVAREVGREFLERAGLRVQTAEDGMAAVELLQRHLGEIECVLLDLTMPGMDGVETHDQLRRVDPELPVILCSGYPERSAVERFAGRGLAGFLEKPYTPERLIAVLHRVLEPPGLDGGGPGPT